MDDTKNSINGLGTLEGLVEHFTLVSYSNSVGLFLTVSILVSLVFPFMFNQFFLVYIEYIYIVHLSSHTVEHVTPLGQQPLAHCYESI